MLGLASFLLVAQIAPALAELPVLDPNVQSHYVSSHDRSGGNDDGFNGTYSALYVDDAGEHVLLDADGPGTLWNLWFTSRVNGRSPLGFGRIRFYLDGEETPRLDMDVDELFSGRHPPFTPPFVYHAFQSTGGYVSYLPISFAKRLKITTERRVGFYNAYYQTYAPDRRVASWTDEEDLSDLRRLWSAAGPDGGPELDVPTELHSGRFSLPAPEMPDGAPRYFTETVWEQDAPGVIRSIRFNPLRPLTPYQLQHIRLRIYWDGEESPSVDAPLGSFFGSGLGEATVRALPLGMSESGAYYCRLPMPFWSGARVELTNENPEATPAIWWQIRVGDNDYPEGTTGHLRARYRREWPTTPDVDYTIAESTGRGLYLGQVMTVEPLRPEVKRWWEGDLRIHLDGRSYPVFHGTGHEDEYLGGWSNEWLMNPYSLPMHGAPRTSGLRQVDFQWSAAVTVYRFFVGGVPFQNGIHVGTEHGARNTAQAMYSSVAYYYHRPDAMERLATIDGPETDASGRTRFTVSVPPGTRHLRLRRSFDPAERQEAEVWLNDDLMGIWSFRAEDPHASQAESDFLLPASALEGQSELSFELRAGGDSFRTYRYELWGLR